MAVRKFSYIRCQCGYSLDTEERAVLVEELEGVLWVPSMEVTEIYRVVCPDCGYIHFVTPLVIT